MAKQSFLEKLPSTARKTQVGLSTLGLGLVISLGIFTGAGFSKQLVTTFAVGLVIGIIYIIAETQKYKIPYFVSLLADIGFSIAIGLVAFRTMNGAIGAISGLSNGLSVAQVLFMSIAAVSVALFALIVLNVIFLAIGYLAARKK